MRESLWHIWSVYLTSALLVATWIAALVYFKVVDSQGNKKTHWDIWSWSCRRKGSHISSHHGKIPFDSLCVENVS